MATKTKTKGAKTTSTATKENAPVKSAAKVTLDSVLNEGKAKEKKEKTPSERVLLYIYPAEINTAEKKKDFRRKARAAIASYRKRIASAEKSGDKKAATDLRKEFDSWTKSHLNQAPTLN